MSKWEMVKLGDYISQIRGVSYTPKDVSELPAETHTAVLRANNIQDDCLNFDDLVYIDKRKIKSQQYLKKGDIVICASSGSKNLVGKAAQVQYDMQVSFGAFCKVVRTDKIYASYLGNFFKSKYYRRTISDLSAGANINNLRNEHIDGLDFPFPPLGIQKQIAKALDLTSEIITLHKNQLMELDNLIESVFYDMFGDPVINEMSWEIKKLSEICDVRDGTHDSPKYVRQGYPLITSKNVVNGTIDFINVNYITQEDFEQIQKRSKVDKGDIIMPMIGTIGNPVIVDTELEFAIKNVALIKFNSDVVINTYIKTLLCLEFFEVVTKKKNRGGTQKFIALGDIRGLEIPLPPLTLQEKFASIVAKIEEQKILVQEAMDESQMLFDSLMSEYFD